MGLRISFPTRAPLSDGATILAADVGGTKTDLALFKVESGALTMVREAVLPSRQFNSLSEAVQFFLEKDPRPARLSIAFAGPVAHGQARATNLKWCIDTKLLVQSLAIPEVFLINDLEAEAYGLAALAKSDLKTIYPANNRSGVEGNVAIIAPGTGLGEAGLFWDGQALHPFATEGGHEDFSPHNEFDWHFLVFLQKQFGNHVSWERVVSGPGIVQIYRFLKEVKNWQEPEELTEKLKKQDAAAAITEAAEVGVPACVETMRLFMRYLATEAANLALKMKATGGLFIGGGIAPKIWDEHLKIVFLDHFFQVGRLRDLLETVPVYLILNEKTALLGAAYYGK